MLKRGLCYFVAVLSSVCLFSVCEFSDFFGRMFE